MGIDIFQFPYFLGRFMKLNICGLVSMILGIIGLFIFPLWFGIASTVLGIVGIATAGIEKGRGMAIAGLVLGIISILWAFWLGPIILAIIAG